MTPTFSDKNGDESAEIDGISRRQAMQRIGTSAAAVGAIAAGGSQVAPQHSPIGRARAASGNPVFVPTGPTAVGLYFGQRAADSISSLISSSDEMTDTQVAMHMQATTAVSWWESATIHVDNRLTDLEMTAHIHARNEGIADSWVDGKSDTEAYQATLAAIEEVYRTPEHNMLDSLAANWLQLGAILEAARAVDDDSVPDNFVSWAPQSYDGDGSIVDHRITEEATTDQIDLVDGSTYDLQGPRLEADWDNEDSGSWTLAEILESWDDDDEEFVLTTEQGNEVRDRGLASVENVSDHDLMSRNVGALWQAAEYREEIHHAAEAAQANYDLNLVDDLYGALDDGLITPEDIRGIEGLATFLSGETDATSDRYQMALMTTLGLDMQDLADVSSISATYTGYTGREIITDSSGDRARSELTDYVEDRELHGMVFGDLSGDDLMAGGSYGTGGPASGSLEGNYIVSQEGGELIDVGTGEVLFSIESTYCDVRPRSRELAVFDGDSVTRYRLWRDLEEIVSLDQLDVIDEIDTDSARYLRYSPSGEYLAWIDNGSDDLVVYDLHLEQSQSRGFDNNTTRNLAWGPDSRTLFFSGHRTRGDSYMYYLRDDGSIGRSSTSCHYSARFDPQGEYLAQVTRNYDGDDYRVRIRDVEDNGIVDILTDEVTSAGHHAEWSPSGDRLFVATSSELIAYERGSWEHLWTVDYVGDTLYWVDDYLLVSDSDTATYYKINPDDGSEIDHFDSESSLYDDGKGFRPAPGNTWADSVDGSQGTLDRAMFFDAARGESIDLADGELRITRMVDRDGNDVEEASWSRPQHDETDMAEYTEYLDHVGSEYGDALEDRESDDSDSGFSFPGIGDAGSALGFGDLGWLRDDIAGIPVWGWILGVAGFFSITGDD